jgi:hypothetical protein
MTDDHHDTHDGPGDDSPDLVPADSGPLAETDVGTAVDFDIKTSHTARHREPEREDGTGGHLVHDWEYRIDTYDGEAYMGRNVKRELVDAHQRDGMEDEPLFFGYADAGDDGYREVGWPSHSWAQHMSIFGTTGKGKSTIQNNLLLQVAQKGYGFCFFDAKGDAVNELLMQLPEHRRDDVVYIEPASPDYDRVVGLNFLEPGPYENETEYNREVEAIIKDLVAILRGGEYWGPRMEGITENIARAMIRSNRNYTLVDMYHVLVDQRSRELFAQAVANEGLGEIKEYTAQIAQMDDEKIDPVMRRIQGWVEDPSARSIVAHRESSVNIAEAVEEGKIILVNLDLRNDDLRRVTATAIIRRIWSHIRKRDEVGDKNFDPFFTVIDEFHQLTADDMDISEMLAMARSAKMPIILSSQNPGRQQIPPEILDQIKANADTLLCLNLRNHDHARQVASRFGEEVEPTDITKMDPYRVATELTVKHEGEYVTTEPFVVDIFPPHWPVRPLDDAREIVRDSLKKHGVPPKEEDLNETELILQQSAGNNHYEASFLEAVWAEQLRQNDQWVAVKEVMDGFDTRTGKVLRDFPDGIDVTSAYLDVKDDDSTEKSGYDAEKTASSATIRSRTTEVSVTDAGVEAVLDQDAARVSPSPVHRAMLRRGFELFSALGMHVSVTRQISNYGDNDATGFRPVDLDVDAVVAEGALQQYENDYPLLTELTDRRQVAIEAEESGISKPAHPIENLRRAYHNTQLAVFLVPAGEDYGVDKDKLATRLDRIFTDPPFVRDERFVLPGKDPDDPDNVRDEPVRVLYNKSDRLELGQRTDDQTKYALVPKSERSIWVDTGDALKLFGGLGEEAKQRGQIRHSEVDFASTNPFQFWGRYDQYNEEWVVYPDDGAEKRYATQEELEAHWQPVYRPLLPEAEFGKDIAPGDPVPGDVDYPTEDDWEIIPVEVASLLEDETDDGDVEEPESAAASTDDQLNTQATDD